MRYKGFTFPGDLWLILTVIRKILYYAYQRKIKPPQDLIALVKAQSGGQKPSKYPGDLAYLEKMRRAANFFLIRVFKSRRPCLIRSCILYEQALRSKLDARLIIGVKHDRACLMGHSWITIGNRPFQEEPAALLEYTIMMKS